MENTCRYTKTTPNCSTHTHTHTYILLYMWDLRLSWSKWFPFRRFLSLDNVPDTFINISKDKCVARTISH